MKIIIFLLFSLIFISCGDKKAEPFGKTTDETLVDQTEVAVDPTLALGEELFNGTGLCKTCHLPDKKVIGPSITEIATIYREKGGNIVEFLKENAGIDEIKMLQNMKTIEEEYLELKEFLEKK